VSDIQRRSRQEAAHWIARLQSDAVSDTERARFAVWLSEAEEHRSAFEDLSTIWGLSGTLMLRTEPKRAAATLSRRMAVAACLAGIVGLKTARSGDEPQMLSTPKGRVRMWDFAAEGHATLDTASTVMVMPGGSREFVLIDGQADIELPHNRTAHFIRSGQHVLNALAGRFSVRTGEKGVQFTAMSGEARVVCGPATSRHVVQIREGDAVLVAPDGTFSQKRPDLAMLQMWKTGRLVFQDTPLQDAVSEMNRYNQKRIELSTSTLGMFKISGTYHYGNAEHFAQALSRVLPVKIVDGPTLRIVKV